MRFEVWPTSCRLLSDPLEERDADEHHAARARLRVSLTCTRAAVEPIAAQIETSLPEFTVHDVTHLDAVCTLLDLLAPPDLELTPTESWSLGVAILLHDLGLAVAAYPGGRDEVRTDTGWPDALAVAVRGRLGRAPSAMELKDAEAEELERADRDVLRRRHADRAAKLTSISFGGHALIEDEALRDGLGDIAGRIAASHWSPVERLVDLRKRRGAPAGMPADWTVRPILLASLLRTADVVHVDATRAPRARRKGRKLTRTSEPHWDFQARLAQPILDSGRLVFDSTVPFGVAEAEAWWTCVEHLRAADAELTAVDALLSDLSMPRLAARSVANVRDLRRLAETVRVDGWLPIDASIAVSDVPQLVRTLGGHQLYGRAPGVPLRELLQNAADAILARQALEPGFRGRIEIRLSSDLLRIEVNDNGIGMSERVMVGPLLDFGRSLWTSPELSEIHPGLQAAGFQPEGRFGIGFFSVFMWTPSVTVVSRSRDDARADTRVLTFVGVGSRPLLLKALASERLNEPGTTVRLDNPTIDVPTNRKLKDKGGDVTASRLEAFLAWLAPALPVDMFLRIDDGEPSCVVQAGDWRTLEPADLLARIGADGLYMYRGADTRLLDVGDVAADPVGRLALIEPWSMDSDESDGPCVLVSGGLRVGASSEAAGILEVYDLDAARSQGVGSLTPEQITSWATSQAGLISTATDTRDLAARVLELGGDPGALAIANTADGLVSRSQLIAWASTRERIHVIDVEEFFYNEREVQWIPQDPRVELPSDVLDVPVRRYRSHEQDRLLEGVEDRSLTDIVVNAIFEAWRNHPLYALPDGGGTEIDVEDAGEIFCPGETWIRGSDGPEDPSSTISSALKQELVPDDDSPF